MFKSNGGFTLVELIVVIAILGLLAGIGIPAYSKYVSEADTKIGTYQGAINNGVAEINAAASEAGMDIVIATEVSTPTTQSAG